MSDNSQERPNFVLTGDHRDIPMGLGLLIMNWNGCEVTLREILQTLACGGDWRRQRLVEPLVHELTSVGIAQALGCYAHELPDENSDLAEALRHIAVVLERARAFRNYYVHGINAVTKYGFRWNDELFEDDRPWHDALIEGPFGSIYLKSGKNQPKFIMDSVPVEPIMKLANYLADFREYIWTIAGSIGQYLSGRDYRQTAPLPPALPLLDKLEKPVLNHPKLHERRALDLDRLNYQAQEDDEEEAERPE
ncbi:hypothetical protein [Sphingosinicella sp. LY1275]|uniref:hypothetical protein n=1 Tax=Sphingosinicella sp. LY1275 TaxID=3095379 RepID=UPI002ADEAC79|nr:hypothetical protein [Sphingosinicella sp. LY1275]MEA1013891.1 hypothetical protein [Sphingosinicella sp. LY1275]